MVGWSVEKVVHFGPDDLVKDGCVHFGFHDPEGHHYLIAHARHFCGLVGPGGRLEWTVARGVVVPGVPNIPADLSFPMYVDRLPDGDLVISNFGSGQIFRVDPEERRAVLWVDGRSLGMKDTGNCVVGDDGTVWVNEVEGCRVWQFDGSGKPLRTLGDGTPGFQPGEVGFSGAQFHWIYDLRRGPEGCLYVLDSRNFALRMIDVRRQVVRTLAGTGAGGYGGDGGDPRNATFGSDPRDRYDGPISLSVDEEGNLFVGDRFNHVVRMIDRREGIITTIAGHPSSVSETGNRPDERDPRRLHLPKISSMDYYRGRLFVPTDLTEDHGDLAVLRRSA